MHIDLTMQSGGISYSYTSIAIAGAGSAFLSGLSRGGFAGSIGLFAVPILAAVLPASVAASVLLLPLCALDAIVVKDHHEKWDLQVIKHVFPSSLVGLALAWWLVNIVSESATEIFMGCAILFASGLRIFHTHANRKEMNRKPGALRAWMWGGFSGFSSFVSHAGGAALMMHVLDVVRDRRSIVATVGLIFAINDIIKLIAYSFLNRFDTSILVFALALVPFSLLGYFIGGKYTQSLSDGGFQLVSTWLLALAALWMIFIGVKHLCV